jgi:hypothetical protein
VCVVEVLCTFDEALRIIAAYTAVLPMVEIRKMTLRA